MRNVLHTPLVHWSISVVLQHWIWPKECISPCGVCYPQYLWLLLIHPSFLLCSLSLFDPALNSHWKLQQPPLNAWFRFCFEHWSRVLYCRYLQAFCPISPSLSTLSGLRPTPAPPHNLLHIQHQVRHIQCSRKHLLNCC